jgi:hypothetical protein
MTVSRPWWESPVIYQVYPRSFQDTDDNGVGDLNGITERLAVELDLVEPAVAGGHLVDGRSKRELDEARKGSLDADSGSFLTLERHYKLRDADHLRVARRGPAPRCYRRDGQEMQGRSASKCRSRRRPAADPCIRGRVK